LLDNVLLSVPDVVKAVYAALAEGASFETEPPFVTN
jgi:hypothetical protein